MEDLRARALIDELRREGIRDENVLSALEKIPREIFVNAPFTHAAYANTALPIACGQTISQPFVVAYMTEALAIAPSARVLEIGTGSGYQAAVLSHLCQRVYTMERHKPLLDAAGQRLHALGIENVVARLGDGHLGWPEEAPFDRILVTAATPEVPPALLEQLAPDGVLLAPLGPSVRSGLHADPESICQLLTKIIRSETGFRQEKLLPVLFVPMIGGVPEAGKNP